MFASMFDCKDIQVLTDEDHTQVDNHKQDL
jgi:hypothetical protein